MIHDGIYSFTERSGIGEWHHPPPNMHWYGIFMFVMMQVSYVSLQRVWHYKVLDYMDLCEI